jgi:uncharacterized phage-associated protein
MALWYVGAMAGLPQFREAKTAQAAALFLHLRGGRMHYIKLLKLLYLADREALRRWGVPITMDRYVSMRHGPVPSRTYGLVVEEGEKPEWSRLISSPMGDYEVELQLANPPQDLLSRAESALITEIHTQFGGQNRWALVQYLHERLAEWKDPGDTSVPISVPEILAACGEGEAEIQAVMAELETVAASESALRR